MSNIKIISWNVNGIRSNIITTGKAPTRGNILIDHDSNFAQMIKTYEPDIVCLQETRCGEDIFERIVDTLGEKETNYFNYKCINPSKRKERGRGSGYSGTALFSKLRPIRVMYGLDTLDEPNIEGRCITSEYDDFYLINVYTPNSGTNEEYRINVWDPAIMKHLNQLKATGKKVILTGDMNVCHKELDVFSGLPKENVRIAGLLPEERQAFQNYVDNNFIDTYRHLHPTENTYTWWNPRIKAFRPQNKGWRIDYTLLGSKHDNPCTMITKAESLTDVFGSDHCPIITEFSF